MTKEDPRLKDIIYSWNDKNKYADVGILGVPFDYGVKLSGGRAGAAHAPDAIRGQIKRYGTAYNIEKNANLTDLRIVDFGNVSTIAKNSRRTHKNITAAVNNTLRHVDTLIILGGGNDISYATIKALSEANNKNIAGMNIDAHFDVRPVLNGRITSGTPYRRLLEGGYLSGKNFFEFAIQGQVNARIHRDWLKEQRARIFFLSDVRKMGVKQIFRKFIASTQKCKALFVSIDIDSVAQSFAPGSSAPSPDGLSSHDILQLSYFAGYNKKVRLFEIMEVNPNYDVDERTSRLAVNMILEFLTGYTKRKKKS